MKNKKLLQNVIITACLLLPFVLIWFISEPGRGRFNDFLTGLPLAIILTIIIGSVIAFLKTRKMTRSYRLGVFLSLSFAFFLSWANAAVGFIGSEDNPLNFIFVAVIILGFIFSLVGRFRPLALTRSLMITAGLQFIAPFGALAIGRPEISFQEDLVGVVKILVINLTFAIIWLVISQIFRHAQEKGK